MRTSPEKVKETAFHKAMKELPRLLSRYEAGDYETLGNMCQHVCMVDEYCGRKTRKLRLANEGATSVYRSRVYAQMAALVIRDRSQAFKFTRKDVVKFIRGEFAHGDSDNRDQKRSALHDFAFESNNEVTLEFAITWAFVIFPGIRSSTGNTDSQTPFVQKINFGDRKIEVTQMESIVINAIYEYIQALMSGRIPWNKVAITNDLDAFRVLLTDEIVDALVEDWEEIQKWQETKEITLISKGNDPTTRRSGRE